ncbi:MAG: hypothetical protein H6711_05610 [Myxococcales bacterium]|nr:hypothetical protein [Myxococcales bacterium]
MSEPPSKISLLLLTEDSGKEAESALRAFLDRLLRRVVAGASVDAGSWDPAEGDVRAVVRGNAWKSPARRELVQLRQYIAAKLRSPGGFVFFHFDGDRPYRDREASENIKKFNELIQKHVRDILGGPPPMRRPRRHASAPPVPTAPLMEKLIPIVPFYSVEAWYFQNTERALAHCLANPKCRGGCQATLATWTADRGALDELIKPKEALCFRAGHNLDLARTSYPLDSVLAARKSLHDLVAQLSACAPLREALEATRPPWWHEPEPPRGQADT